MHETTILPAPPATLHLPTHLDLPEEDGNPVPNFHHPAQSSLLTECFTPRLQQLRPDGQFIIGEDSGVYWEYFAEQPLRGYRAPYWYCVLGVATLFDGDIRRSYVMWHEPIPPLIVFEYVSEEGVEEHDRTPMTGKFWIYERRIRAPFYVILDRFRATLEVYHLAGQGYVPVPANGRGRFPVEPLGVELGLWRGEFRRLDTWWVRPWDSATGEMLPSLVEVAERHRRRAESERERAESERERAEEAERQLATERAQLQALMERLRQAGLEPPESGGPG